MMSTKRIFPWVFCGLTGLAMNTMADPTMDVILGRPTDHSVCLSAMSAKDVNAYVEIGEKPGSFVAKTAIQKLRAGVPFEFEIGALESDMRYYYRMVAQTPGQHNFVPAQESSFHTRRAPDRAFTFALQGDSHPERAGKMFAAALYALTLQNVAKQGPDFYITLGDDFSIERLIGLGTLSQGAVDRVYAAQRAFLGAVGRSAPLFLVNGNHEQAAQCNLDGTANNCAVLAALARTRLYPLPEPGKFYTGDSEPVPHVGLLRDYYAWTWGDALFVVIDPYWHSAVPVDNEAGGRGHGREGKQRNLWDITLGDTQYQWLAKTLTESKARWKFVFCHHVLGTGRGGVEMAGLCEWGGHDRNGIDRFAEKRPGWALPVHDLMAKTGVTIFFQGHDHLFARQERDGVVYQTCPNPADAMYQLFNDQFYRSGDILPNSGYLKVTVAPTNVEVEYIRSWLPADETAAHHNGEVASHYSIPYNPGKK